jgi:hypothetical protein
LPSAKQPKLPHRKVSANGGAYPAWSGSGKELFFESITNDFFVCPVAVKGSAIDVGTPQHLTKVLEIYRAGSSECRAVQGGVEGKRYIPVYAKLRDGSGNGAFAEAITRSGRADGTGISSCGDVCA